METLYLICWNVNMLADNFVKLYRDTPEETFKLKSDE